MNNIKLKRFIKRFLLASGIVLLLGVCFQFSIELISGLALKQIFKGCDSSSEECNFTKSTSKEVFVKYVWSTITPEVTKIEAVEGKVDFSEGPVYVRFEATERFVNKLLEGNVNYGPYTLSNSCAAFAEETSTGLTKRFPEKFMWWTPWEVNSPVCYVVKGYQDDDSKYLLIDSANGIVYFYRTATCGLCPD